MEEEIVREIMKECNISENLAKMLIKIGKDYDVKIEDVSRIYLNF